MAKVKVEVLDAVVDGKGKGAKLEIDKRSADYLASINYVKIVEADKPKPKTKKPKQLKKEE
jgi:hypothetical protein